LLEKRLETQSWRAVLKTLSVIHTLFRDADVAFMDEFAANGTHLLTDKCFEFVDRESVNGLPYSAFIREYSRYLYEKVHNFNELSFNVEKKLEPSNKSFFNDYNPNQLGKCLPKFMKQMNALVECHGIIAGNDFVIHDIVRHAVLLLIKDSLRLYPSIQLCLWQMICSFQKLTLEQVKWTSRTWNRYLKLNKAYEEWFRRCVRLDIIEESFAPKFDVLSESLIVKLNEYIEAHGGDDKSKKPETKKSKDKAKRKKSDEEDWEAFDNTNANIGNDESEPKNTGKGNRDSSQELPHIDELLDSHEMNELDKDMKKLNQKPATESKQAEIDHLFSDDNPFATEEKKESNGKKKLDNSNLFDDGDNWLEALQKNPPANTVSNTTLDWLSDLPTTPPQTTQQQQPWMNNNNTSMMDQQNTTFNKNSETQNDFFAAFDNGNGNTSNTATTGISGGQARKLEKRTSKGKLQGDMFGDLMDLNDWS